ncbi:PDZ domain-containing protein, partial [bacterium]|nr:PDZ domain-containing protein [bacterium]
ELTSRTARRFGYEDEDGVVVTDVKQGSVADEKGVQSGDLIKEVDRRKVTSVGEVQRIVESIDPGKIVLFQIQRGGRNSFVAMRKPRS